MILLSSLVLKYGDTKKEAKRIAATAVVRERDAAQRRGWGFARTCRIAHWATRQTRGSHARLRTTANEVRGGPGRGGGLGSSERVGAHRNSVLTLEVFRGCRNLWSRTILNFS